MLRWLALHHASTGGIHETDTVSKTCQIAVDCNRIDEVDRRAGDLLGKRPTGRHLSSACSRDSSDSCTD